MLKFLSILWILIELVIKDKLLLKILIKKLILRFIKDHHITSNVISYKTSIIKTNNIKIFKKFNYEKNLTTIN